MRTKNLILLLIACLLVIVSSVYGEFNPDGKIWHTGINIALNLPQVGGETQTQPALSLILPLAKNTTILLGYSNLSVGTYSYHTFLSGANLHTHSIDNLNDLVNPDGIAGGFVFSPYIGLTREMRRSINNFNAGMDFSWVISNFTTIRLSYVLTREKNYSHHNLIIGPRLHFQKNLTTENFNRYNPDGQSGLITMFPHFGAIIYQHRDAFLIYGLELTSPLNQNITLHLLLDHLSGTGIYDDESANQYAIGFTLYL